MENNYSSGSAGMICNNALAVTKKDVLSALQSILTLNTIKNLVLYIEPNVSDSGKLISRKPTVRRAEMADLFVKLFEHILCYSAKNEIWQLYDGTIWKNDLEGTALKLAEVMAEQFAEAAKLCPENLKHEIVYTDKDWNMNITVEDALTDSAEWLSKPKHAKEILNMAKNMMIASPYKYGTCYDAKQSFENGIVYFDTPETRKLLNLRNGTYRFENGKLQPHSPNDFITQAAGVEFDPRAKCIQWIRFLNDVFDGDQEMISSLQKICYSAITMQNTGKAFAIYSRNPSICEAVVNTLKALFGNYADEIDPEALIKEVQHPDRPAPESILSLQNARLITLSTDKKCSEWLPQAIAYIAEPIRMTARRTHQNPVSFERRGTVIFKTSAPPYLKGSKYRLGILKLKDHAVSFKQDCDFEKVFLAELPGILNWILEGKKAFEASESRIVVPEVNSRTGRKYLSDEDAVDQFFTECVTGTDFHTKDSKHLLMTAIINKDENGWHLVMCRKGNCTELKLIWYAYCVWCNDNSIKPLGRTLFARIILKKCNYHKEKRRAGYCDGKVTIRNLLVRSIVYDVRLSQDGIDYLKRYVSSQNHAE